MARKYSRKASAKVGRALRKRKAGTLKSGGSGKTVKSRKQAIAIGLSEARKEGKKVPPKESRQENDQKEICKAESLEKENRAQGEGQKGRAQVAQMMRAGVRGKSRGRYFGSHLVLSIAFNKCSLQFS